MEHVIVGTQENFDQLINGDLPVLVDFWAPWCGPCRMVSPFVDALAEEYAGKINVVKVNVDEQGDIAGRYRVSSIPNLITFKDGEVVEQSAGARPKALIAKMIEQVL